MQQQQPVINLQINNNVNNIMLSSKNQGNSSNKADYKRASAESTKQSSEPSKNANSNLNSRIQNQSARRQVPSLERKDQKGSATRPESAMKSPIVPDDQAMSNDNIIAEREKLVKFI